MIEHKIYDVPDSVCEECLFLAGGECWSASVALCPGEDRRPCVPYTLEQGRSAGLDRMDYQTIVVLIFAFGVILTLLAVTKFL